MRPEPKKPLKTNAAESPRPGLNDGLKHLSVPDLPPGPDAPAKAESRAAVWKMGRVVLRRETAGRGGKSVIVVDDFASHLPAALIESTAKKLRGVCGCGGTVRGRTIELQGDQPARVRAVLEAEGFQVAGIR